MDSAIIYCRVSTVAQGEGASLPEQEADLRDLAAKEGLEVGQVFRESKSGTTLDRPQLDAVRQLVQSHAIDALLVWAPDRLSRDPLHLLLLAEECDQHGVRLLFRHEPLDFSTEGQLLTFVRGWAAKVENLRRQERFRLGKRAAKAAGRMTTGTGPYGLYGYRVIVRDRGRPIKGMRSVVGKDAGTRTVHEPEAETVRSVYGWLVNEQLSLHALADRLNDRGLLSPGGARWRWDSLRRIVKNPAYVGDSPGTQAIIGRSPF